MKAYYCVGGPLDGEYATTEDFYSSYESPINDKYSREEGMYYHLKVEYAQYNSAGWGNASMLWIHKSNIKSPISPKDR